MNSRRLSSLASIVVHFVRARWRWQHLDRNALARYQELRAQRIVEYTSRHSSFYRAHWRGHDLHAWRTLPTVDKQTMMDNFDTFTTSRITRTAALDVALQAERSRDFSPVLQGLTVGLSSGTSGHRGLFLASPDEQAAWAGTILARTLQQIPWRGLRVAFFLRSNSNLYQQVGSRLIQFRYFDLMLPIDQAVRELNAFQPHIVIGPPSLLGFLANERLVGHLQIQPERLISVAEVLEEQDRVRLQESFDASVQQIYQCTEGLLAISCAHGSLHIQEDLVHLQFEPLAPAPDSVVGEEVSGHNGGERVMPIVTDLWRTTQPIIRYRLNDILQLATEPCACGSAFRVIRAIEGRCDDVCIFFTLTGEERPFFPDTIRRMILLASPHIRDYRVVQEQSGQLHIYLAIESGIAWDEVMQAVQTSVVTTIAQYACQPAIVQIEEGLPADVVGTKRRRVQRRV